MEFKVLTSRCYCYLVCVCVCVSDQARCSRPQVDLYLWALVNGQNQTEIVDQVLS